MRKTLLIAVLIHFVIAGWHGFTHEKVPVLLNPAQTAFVAIVIVILPLLGAALTFTKYQRQGAIIVFASMLASVIFGLIYHFVHISPDHVSQVAPGPWQTQFIVSAILVLIAEVAGTYFGAKAMRHWAPKAT
jgi:predicted permease